MTSTSKKQINKIIDQSMKLQQQHLFNGLSHDSRYKNSTIFLDFIGLKDDAGGTIQYNTI